MNISDFNYCEFVSGSVTHRNTIIDQRKIVKGDFEGKPEQYMSMFRFDASLLRHVEDIGSIKNFGGLISFENVYLDFDCETDIPKAQKDIQDFIQYGLQEFITFNECDHLRISFSGCKGFSLGIPKQFFTKIIPAVDLNLRVKAFVKSIAELTKDNTGAELKTLDMQIYNKDRIFRLNNSVNIKSGLFKIPLTYAELNSLSVPEIMELAKQTRTIEQAGAKNITPCKALTDLFYSLPIESNHPAAAGVVSNTAGEGFNFAPAEKGNRNKALLRNSSYLRFKNIPFDVARDILSHWNNSNPEPLPTAEFDVTLKSAFSYDKKETPEISETDFINFDRRLQIYSDYVKNVSKKKNKLGFPKIDDMLRGLRPGNIITLLAGTGIGKSAIAQNILQAYTKQTGELTLFFSLEMAAEEILERELQLEFDMAGYSVENAFLKSEPEILERCKLIRNTQNNFYTVVKRTDISVLKDYITALESMLNKKVGFVCVDYLALLGNKVFDKDEYLRISDNMKRLKFIAKELSIPILVLSQVSRFEIKGEAISLYGGKGSGEIENSSDIILSLEKSKYHPSTEKMDYLVLSILKSRRGGSGRTLIEFNRHNLRMEESSLEYGAGKNGKTVKAPAVISESEPNLSF